ncbi:MAG: hypothetical protein GY822_21115 [Deltaproteobacteria bacterium]|nr:hypothetical protein [Deltaproteobacteria bacterium]
MKNPSTRVQVSSNMNLPIYFDKTPFVGGVYYPKLRWLAKRLASPGAELQKEPLSWLGVGMTMWIAAIVVLNLARWL